MTITECFVERPQFAKWREDSPYAVAKRVIGKNTEWSFRVEKLVTKNGSQKEIEHLYEFLAARGHLRVFDQAWTVVENLGREKAEQDDF